MMNRAVTAETGPNLMDFLRSLLLRLVVLVVVSVLLGGVIQFVRRDPIAWFGDWAHYIETLAREEGLPLVNREAVRAMLQDGSRLILDARPAAEYRAGHLETALSMPADDPAAHAEILSILTPEDGLMIYCSGVDCDDSIVLARQLVAQGFTNIVLYAGGWAEWSAGE